MNKYILSGMQFGDEGKGTFVDYLAHKVNAGCIVKYNGGSQASHTVITPDGILHKFSQLGSGMFCENCHTFLDQNMVINLENLVTEMKVFSEKTGIPFSDLRDRIHIHEDCYIVTPYHKLSNKLRELASGENRRGSVGTGVSEVKYFEELHTTSLHSPKYNLTVHDIFRRDDFFIFAIFSALHKHVKTFYTENKSTILANASEEIKVSLNKEINFLLYLTPPSHLALKYIHDFKKAPDEFNFSKCMYSYHTLSYNSAISNGNTIFEGSQGLLLDYVYGLKPNTTLLDTTNQHATNGLCEYFRNVENIGIAKAFSSRHGLGVFPTEDDAVNNKISDINQEKTFWNGQIRFGWFDSVLLKYAQMINKVETLYLSSLDKLSKFEKIKICIAYVYNGEIDETFENIFNYAVKANGLIIISSIKEPHDVLSKYLEKCCPIYLTLDGWKTDISNIRHAALLPNECLKYIRTLEELCGLPINVVSVGPTRSQKIEIH